MNPTKPEVAAVSAAAAGVPPATGGAGGGSKYVPPNQRGGEGHRGEMMGGGSRMNRDGGCVECAVCGVLHVLCVCVQMTSAL